MRRFLSALAVGAVAVLGFGTQQAEALLVTEYCEPGDTGCTQLGSLTAGAGNSSSDPEWIGNIHDDGDTTTKTGQASVQDIIDFKVAVGEVPNADVLIDFGKINGVDNSPLFNTDVGLPSTTGTITYIGGFVDLMNIVLKFDAKPIEIYKITGLTNGDTFDWETPQELSNVQFIGTPIPGAVWLFGTGLLGLLGIGYSRRRKAAA